MTILDFKTIYMKQYLLFLSVFFVLASFQFNSKEESSYSYLEKCFNEAEENFEMEVSGIGEFQLNNSISETSSLSYFEVPKDKLGEKPSQIVKLVAAHYIKTWKNNSKILKEKAFKANGCDAMDLRLHMNLEDFDMQEIIIHDNGKVYIITATEDESNRKHFDGLVQLIEEKKCVE